MPIQCLISWWAMVCRGGTLRLVRTPPTSASTTWTGKVQSVVSTRVVTLAVR